MYVIAGYRPIHVARGCEFSTNQLIFYIVLRKNRKIEALKNGSSHIAEWVLLINKVTLEAYGHLVPGGNKSAVGRLDDTDQTATIRNKTKKGLQ